MTGTEAASAPEGLRLFLSYARHDSAVAEQWVEALQALGHEVFRDTTGIPFGAAWREWIRAEIVRADAVVFLVSVAWIESINCREELEVAQQDGKRLLPVAWGVRPERMPEVLSGLNSIVADPGEPLAGPVASVDAAARTDPAWLLIHRRLLQEAKDWERNARTPRLLRRRVELQQLEQSLEARDQPAPALTALQVEFVGASRQAAETRRRWTWTLGTSVVAMLVLAGAVALLQSRQRAEQESIANARRLLQAAEQAFQPARSPHAALRLALAARAAKPLPEVDDFLRRALAVMPEVARTLPDLPGPTEPKRWWMASDLAAAPGGSGTWAVFHDGQRNVRILQVPTAQSDAVTELPANLPRGWVGAVSTYGGLVAFQPEPADASPVAGAGPEVRLLTLPELALVGSFALPGSGPTAVALDAEGGYLALTRDGRVEVWQLESRRKLGTWQAPADAAGIQALRVHPTGRWVAAVPSNAPAGRAPLWLVDMVQGRAVELSTFADPPQALAFDRDGRRLAAVDRQGSLRIFSLDKQRESFDEIRRIALDNERVPPRSLALSPDGTQIAVQGRNGEVFDVRTGQRTAFVDAGGPLQFSPDGLSLWGGDDVRALGFGRHGVVTRWRLPSASEFLRAQTTNAAGLFRFDSFDFLPGSHDLVAVMNRGLVWLNGSSGRSFYRPPLSARTGVDRAAADPEAGVLRVLTQAGIWTVDATRDKAVRVPATGLVGFGRHVIASDGRRALQFTQRMGDGGKPGSLTLRSLDLADGSTLGEATLPGHEMGLLPPTLGGRWLVLPAWQRGASALGCTRLELRALNDLGRVQATWPCPVDDGDVLSAAQVDRSGTRLVLASERRVRILSLPDLRETGGFDRPLDSFSQLPDAMALSPDGAWIAVLDRSRRVIVSDLNGDVQARLPFASDGVSNQTSVRFSSDGRRLAAHVGPHAGRDSIWVWDWSAANLQAQACARLGRTRPDAEGEPVLRRITTEPCPLPR